MTAWFHHSSDSCGCDVVAAAVCCATHAQPAVHEPHRDPVVDVPGIDVSFTDAVSGYRQSSDASEAERHAAFDDTMGFAARFPGKRWWI